MDDKVPADRDPEMYGQPSAHATNLARRSHRGGWLGAAEGATLGIVFWVLLFTLGVAWVFHIGGFDGMLPCAIIGALLGAYGRRRLALVGVMAAALVLLVVVYTPIISGPVHSYIRSDPLPSRADAIMVLSAGMNDDGTISTTAVDRLIKGLELFNRGIASNLVLSREAYIVNGRIVTSKADQERIVSLSPNALSKLVVAGITHSTHDEAISARDLFRSRGWTRMIIVTSPMHTRRACATFEHVGVVVTCVPSNTRHMAIGLISTPDDRVRAFQVWLYELAGTIRYRQLGWI
jgi:uncharacterized SAM-binding protein YcdF (DUF218 family)